MACVSQDAYERPAVCKFEDGQKMREVKTPLMRIDNRDTK